MEEKQVLAVASYEKQKYYFAPEFDELPQSIKDEIKIMCVMTAQKLLCTFVMKFEETGSIYFETIRQEMDFDFDEIGAELEIKQLQRTHKDLLQSLQTWYTVKKETGFFDISSKK